jgi:hypothetical protein
MTNTRIDIKQREHLVDLIESAKDDEREQLERKEGATREGIGQSIAEAKGFPALLKKARALYDQISAIRRQIDEIERKFAEAGFDRGEDEDDTLALKSYGLSHATRRLVDGRLEAAKRPIEKSSRSMTLLWLASGRLRPVRSWQRPSRDLSSSHTN